MWKVVIDALGDAHFWPVDEEHKLYFCPCEPDAELVGEHVYYRHYAYDQRELFETNDKWV